MAGCCRGSSPTDVQVWKWEHKVESEERTIAPHWIHAGNCSVVTCSIDHGVRGSHNERAYWGHRREVGSVDVVDVELAVDDDEAGRWSWERARA